MAQYTRSLEPMAISELMTICSPGLPDVSKLDVAPLRAVINLIKLEYLAKPEVFKGVLSLLYLYDPKLGQTHVQHTIRHLRVLLSACPDLADNVISLLPPPVATSNSYDVVESPLDLRHETNCKNITTNVPPSYQQLPTKSYRREDFSMAKSLNMMTEDNNASLYVPRKPSDAALFPKLSAPAHPPETKGRVSPLRLSAFKEYKNLAPVDLNDNSLFSGILRATMKRNKGQSPTRKPKRKKSGTSIHNESWNEATWKILKMPSKEENKDEITMDKNMSSDENTKHSSMVRTDCGEYSDSPGKQIYVNRQTDKVQNADSSIQNKNISNSNSDSYLPHPRVQGEWHGSCPRHVSTLLTSISDKTEIHRDSHVLSGFPIVLPQHNIRIPAIQMPNNPGLLAIPGRHIPGSPRIPIFSTRPLIDNRFLLVSPYVPTISGSTGNSTAISKSCDEGAPNRNSTNPISLICETDAHKHTRFPPKLTAQANHDHVMQSTISSNKWNNDAQVNHNSLHTDAAQLVTSTSATYSLTVSTTSEKKHQHRSRCSNFLYTTSKTPWVRDNTSLYRNKQLRIPSQSSRVVRCNKDFFISDIAGPFSTHTSLTADQQLDIPIHEKRTFVTAPKSEQRCCHFSSQNTHITQPFISTTATISDCATSVLSVDTGAPVMSSRVYRVPLAQRYSNISNLLGPVRPKARYPVFVQRPLNMAIPPVPSYQLYDTQTNSKQRDPLIHFELRRPPFGQVDPPQFSLNQQDAQVSVGDVRFSKQSEPSKHLDLLQEFVNQTCTKRKERAQDETSMSTTSTVPNTVDSIITDTNKDLSIRDQHGEDSPLNIALPSGIQLRATMTSNAKNTERQLMDMDNVDSPKLSRYLSKLINRPPNLGIKDIWMSSPENSTTCPKDICKQTTK